MVKNGINSMITLYIIRHGSTQANAKHRIQGPNNRSRLSQEGEDQIGNLIKSNYKVLKGINGIVVSQTLRSRQSGGVAARQLNTELKLEIDTSLTDFNPGILTGLTHGQAEKIYPAYYQIWKKHGDLDGIPKSETGDVLQARIIAFLAQYLKKKTNGKELIITHAGVIRCLVNTCLGKKRENQIDVGHNKMYILKDPWKEIDVKKFNLGKSEMVYKVKTVDRDYVLKIKKDYSLSRTKFQSDLMNYLATKSLPISPILYTHKNRLDNEEIIQVMKYIPGENIFGRLNCSKTKNLLHLIFSLKTAFEKYPGKSKTADSNLPYLKNKLSKALENTADETLYIYGSRLISTFDKRYLNKQNSIVFWDLHRGNILFDNENPSLIDFECLIRAPETFQLASLLAACFQLENPKDFKLCEYTYMWPEKVDLKELVYFMKIRHFLGAAFFMKLKKNRNLSIEESGILSRYLDSIRLLESEESI